MIPNGLITYGCFALVENILSSFGHQTNQVSPPPHPPPPPLSLFHITGKLIVDYCLQICPAKNTLLVSLLVFGLFVCFLLFVSPAKNLSFSLVYFFLVIAKIFLQIYKFSSFLPLYNANQAFVYLFFDNSCMSFDGLFVILFL